VVRTGSGGTGKKKGLIGAVHTSVRGKRENVSVMGVFKNRKHIWPTGLGEGDGGLQRECEPVWPGWAC
jgi:hypothetical protein